MEKPKVGDIVHYVSHGTPGGEYGKECRAAVVTSVGVIEQVSLAVLNPTGMFFNECSEHHEAPETDTQEPGGGALNHPGGTWHFKERA